jgi:hypothetical protein
VHYDDPPEPYYTVSFGTELGGGERNVKRDKLVPCV